MTGDPSLTDDRIHIQELELVAPVGVLDEERARPQRLTVSLTLWPQTSFDKMQDQIELTVDYAAVCDAVKELVAKRTDKLIETLVDAIASHVLRAFPLAEIRVELRKFILPDVQYVAALV